MKKLAILAALSAFTATVNAASITWGFGGKVYLYDGTTATLASESTAPAVAAGSYLALVYLGQNVTSYNLSDVTEAMAVDKLSYGVTTTGKSSAIGKWNPNSSTYDDLNMQSGASFTVLFYNGATSAFDYVYALSGSDKGAAFDSNIVTVSGDDMVRASANVYGTAGTGSTAGVASVAVPEPSTAALALAGLALLLKRRKA